MTVQETPSQTVGPFFSIALPWDDGPFVVTAETPGAIRIVGRVLDATGAPVTDALVEIWQADPAGRFDHPDDPHGARPGFRGFGRCPTDGDGRFEFVTLPPGAVSEEAAPHIDVSVFARGLLRRLVTRLYFPGEAAANERDPVLSAIADPDARATLIAAEAPGGYRFDIHLSGPHETVFFDL